MFKQLLVCVSGRPGSEAAQMKRSMMKGASDIFDNGAVNKPVNLLTFFNDTLFTVTHIRIIIQITDFVRQCVNYKSGFKCRTAAWKGQLVKI